MFRGCEMFSQLRLAIAGVVLVAFISVVAIALWYRGMAIAADRDRAQAQAALSTALDANRVQQETIGRLRAEQARVGDILAGVADQIAGINTKMTESNAAIAALKDDNATVRDYLNAPIPEPLRSLLDTARRDAH